MVASIRLFFREMKFFLWIATAVAQRGICFQKKHAWAPCNKDFECFSNLCYEDKCAYLPLHEGEKCGPRKLCGPGLGCSRLGRCEQIAKEGDRCQFIYFGRTLCSDGLLCYRGRCLKPGGVKSYCSDDDRCGRNLNCFGGHHERNICVPSAKKGHGCYLHSDCEDNLFCDHFQCARKSKKDGECNSNAQCEDGLTCLPNTSIFSNYFRPLTCQDPPNESEPCLEICKPGLYCDLIRYS